MTNNFEFFSKVLGSSFAKMSEDVFSILEPEDELVLVPEPDNKFDKNAIMIYFGEFHIGYIAKETAAKLIKDVEDNRVKCTVSNITGGNGLNYGCNIKLVVERSEDDKSNTII